MNGKAGPGLKAFDEAMLKIMDRHGIPGASLAIAKEGKLVLAKGYGWANIASGKAIQPDTLFGLASLSKPLTAIAVLKLVEQGKLEASNTGPTPSRPGTGAPSEWVDERPTSWRASRTS